MLGEHAFVLPIILVVYLPLSFFITYGIAVCEGHVQAGFPYISDTGTFPPESCVFGQLLNIGAVLFGVTVHVRYMQIDCFYRNTGRPKVLLVNRLSYGMAIVAAVGVSMVGNFQETNVIAIHLLGACLAFGVGGLYCFTQTGLSFKIKNLPGASACTRKVRVVLCIADIILLIALFVASKLAFDKMQPSTDRYKWTPGDEGYSEHLVSTVSEWVIAIVTVSFLLTFVREFSQIRVQPMCVSFQKKTQTAPEPVIILPGSSNVEGTDNAAYTNDDKTHM
ncbi:hypothetical protein ScPMuIL_016211 [Solemya velum]